MRYQVLQSSSRKAQAVVALKPVIPSSDLLSMLTCCLEGLLAGLCTACTAQSHMVRQQQSCCVMGILPLSRTAEKLKGESLLHVLHKALGMLGEEFGELSDCCLNTYSEQNSFSACTWFA